MQTTIPIDIDLVDLRILGVRTMLSESELSELSSEPLEAVVQMWQFYSEKRETRPSEFNSHLAMLSLLNAYYEEHSDSLRSIGSPPSIKLSGQKMQDIEAIVAELDNYGHKADLALNRLQATRFLEESKENYSTLLGSSFGYRFQDDELADIQRLIDELRQLIANAEIIDPGHKGRLLRKLEALQSELHETMSNLDRFWGFFGDLSFAIRKFGEALEPMTQRAGEIVDIVLRVQTRAEGVAPLLPAATVLLLGGGS